ncbi:MAG: hypothetical protein WAM11_06500 [Cyanobium sp.]
MTGADRQWQLNRRNFEGRWCGTSRWYQRDGDGALELQLPSRVIADTCYEISFRDQDQGQWDGSGLLFAPDGRRRLPLSRQTYNRGGQCWQFEAAAGQSSLTLDPGEPRWGHELNLFTGRSRSMLVLLWGRHDTSVGCHWRLDVVGAVAFRCSLAEPPDPPRPTASDSMALLEQQRGWPGRLENLEPGRWPAEPIEPQECEPFAPQAFALHPLTVGFADGLVCSVPEWLPQGAFSLQVGCRLAPDRFDQLSLQVDPGGRLNRWERRRFTAGG